MVLNNSIMPLTQTQLELGLCEDAPLFAAPAGTALLARAKEAFYHVACSLKDSGRRVLVPAYTCATVYLPFEQAGWTYAFYKIDRHMRIDSKDFLRQLELFRPDVVVVHPYYGQDLDDQEKSLLKRAKLQGCFIIEDLTQCMDSKRRDDFVDAYMGSMRKWLPIPDGAFYYSKTLPLDASELPEYTDFVAAMRDAMFISNLYNETGTQQLWQISRQINQKGGEGKCAKMPTQVHRMSDFSRRILYGFDFDTYAARRLRNARYLWEELRNCRECTPVYANATDITTGPLWFPIYTSQDPQQFRQERLQPAHIRAVRMWHTKEPDCYHRLSDQVWDLYFHTLQLPIGLDYSKEEMNRIVDSIIKDPGK